MAIHEKSGIFTYKGSDGNNTLLYPITKKENVDGLEEIDQHLASRQNPHSVTAQQVGALEINIKGKPNGVATLDADGKVPESQLPALGGHTAQAEEPVNRNLLWVDTSDGNILKFYDASAQAWVPVGAVWS